MSEVIATCKEMPVIPDIKVLDKKRKKWKKEAEEEEKPLMFCFWIANKRKLFAICIKFC
jgi:hypothetical protein